MRRHLQLTLGLCLLAFARAEELRCLLTPPEEEGSPPQLHCGDNTTWLPEGYHPSERVLPGHALFWVYLFSALGVILFAGLMSGLTVGLMSLDVTTLNVLSATSEDPRERSNARKLIPLLRRHHFLLVTLLLSNAVAMEALPILLDRISSAIVAIAVSVTAVLFFGEVIPQALCKKYGIAIGANTVWIVKVLMFFTAPLSWPISRLLDHLLGHSNGTYYRRTQLKELVKLHGVRNEDNADPLTHNEIIIIRGVLEMKEKKVGQIMTPMERASYVVEDTPLTDEEIRRLAQRGHSRIPVFSRQDPNAVVGALLVKRLVLVDRTVPPPAGSQPLAKVLREDQSKPLFNLFNDFILNNAHMAVVYDGARAVGLVTIEDVIEELIQEEIEEEEEEESAAGPAKVQIVTSEAPSRPPSLIPAAFPVVLPSTSGGVFKPKYLKLDPKDEESDA